MKTSAYKNPIFYLKVLIIFIILGALIHNAQLKLGLFYTIFYNPFSTLVIIALCYLMVLAHAWRWFRLISVQGIDLSFYQTIAPTYIGIAFNIVLPGSIGGDVFRLYYVLKNFPRQKSAVILSILVDRVVGLLGIFIVAGITLTYYFEIFDHDSTLFDLLIVCISVCFIALAGFLTAFLLLSKRLGLADWLIAQFAHKRWSKHLIALIDAAHLYRNSKLVVFESLLLSMFTQVLVLIVVLMLNQMMALPRLSIFDYMLALIIAQIANLLPVTPGGIGVGEAAFANILLLINPGITAPYATIFFALRLLSSAAYLPGVFLGIFGFNILQQNDMNLETQTKSNVN